MDLFTGIVLGGMALIVLFVLALGFFYPGSGAEQLDWHPTRSPELEAQNEVDDHEQMLDAINEKRARRGLPALEPEDIDMKIAEDRALRRSLRERP